VNTVGHKLIFSAVVATVAGLALAAYAPKAWSAATAAAGSPPQATEGAASAAALANAPVPIRQLSFLVGEWKARETYKSDILAPAGATGTGTLSVNIGAKGLALNTAYSGKFKVQNSEKAVAGHGEIAFDLGTHGYAISTSANRGGAMSRLAGTGDWNWEVLSFHGTMIVNGRKMAARVLFYNLSHYSFSTLLSLGPNPKVLEPAVETTYTRVNPSRAEAAATN
jgi:hypothetical protein